MNLLFSSSLAFSLAAVLALSPTPALPADTGTWSEAEARNLPGPPADQGDGLRATSFSNADLTGRAVSWITPVVDFDWSTNAGPPGVPRERFSVRWEGEVLAPTSETYTFHVTSDDRARLWLNGQLLVDEGSGHAVAEASSPPVVLEAGRRYYLRLEYFQYGQAAVAKLAWSSPSTPKQIIPRSQWFSRPQDIDQDGLPDAWELAMGLNPAWAADAAEDLDGDGRDGREEYQAGTHPLLADARAANLPSPWLSQDIGYPQQRGSARHQADGSFRVVGSGWDIWGNADGFHLVYQPFTGNGQIIARIVSQENTDPWAKAGVMLREDLSESARHVLLGLAPENGVTFQRRAETGGPSADDAGGAATAPVWVKLVREGNRLSGYRSGDGAQWQWVASEEIPLPERIYAGLAVSSHNNSRTSEAIFDQVMVIQNGHPTLAAVATTAGTGDGLLATYVDQESRVTIARTDPLVNFDWGAGFPAPGIGPDGFTVRWEGLVEAPASETYAFQVVSDDGARLWLDGRKIVDWWGDHAERGVTGKVPLLAGHRYLLRLEYYERSGQAVAKLLWSSPSLPKQPIPQSQLYSPAHPAYAQVPDQDRDGLPDRWERSNGCNDADAADAGEDPDQDGLTNLQEYQAGTDPRAADTDGDGLPDLWEARHGLNPLEAADASRDADGDGLANAQEFELGSNPQAADSDGDGLDDRTELEESGTNPLKPEVERIVTVAEVLGADYAESLGRWIRTETSVYAEDRRGELTYHLVLPEAGMYRLEIEGAARLSGEREAPYRLRVWVDEEFLGTTALSPKPGDSGGLAHLLLPWLGEGPHACRVYWDNVAESRSLEIKAVRVQALEGPDANQNGRPDWVDSRLKHLCGIDTPAAFSGENSGVLVSATSPFCLEGRGGFLSMLRLPGGIKARPGAGSRWYANIPLSPEQPMPVVVSFQNGGLLVTNVILWRPVNLLESPSLLVRQGDALLLTAAPTSAREGTMTLGVLGVTNYTGALGQPMMQRFEQAGLFTLTGSYQDTAGSMQSRTVQVKVVAASFEGRDGETENRGEGPAVWVGRSRVWTCSHLPPEAVVQADPRLKLEPIQTADQATGRRFNLGSDSDEPRFIVARLGEQGPVLAHTEVQGFTLYSSRDAYLRVADTCEDGSHLVAMGLVLSPVRPQVTVQIQVVVGGVTFEDGTITKRLTAGDFDPLGQAQVRFLWPKASKTSTCHLTKALEGAVLLGIHK